MHYENLTGEECDSSTEWMTANKTVTIFSNYMALKAYMKSFLLFVLFATYIITSKK